MALSTITTRARATTLTRKAGLSLKASPVRMVVARAEPTESSSAEKAPATVYYAGKEYTEEQWAAAVASGQVTTAAPAASPAAAMNGGLSLADAMAFSGPAPELINGRLAMLGFSAAAAAEFTSDVPVLTQWACEPTLIALTFALIAAASFPPLLAGRMGEKIGPFTPEAEKLNGRAAMIGFAALLISEGVKHGALF